MNKIGKVNKYFYLLTAIFVFLLFSYITKITPLQGDDWGYALNSYGRNPFVRALEFYNSWSGRYFSELWGFIITPRRWVWDIINPLLFTSIFICIYTLTNTKKYYTLIPLMILSLILTVDNDIRIETYTWIMGTTYVIPLALSLIYYIIIEKLIFKKVNKLFLNISYLVTNIILFYIGLTMENIAAIMILSGIILSIYTYLKKTDLKYLLFSNTIVSFISFMILRMSPGSNYRLERDNVSWINLNIFEKIENGIPEFIRYTFLDNYYLIVVLSVVSILLVLFKNTKTKKRIITITLAIAAIVITSLNYYNILTNATTVLYLIFWIIFTLDIIYNLFILLQGENQLKAIFYFIIAGTSNLVMLYSPLFGPRSSLYTIFYIIIVICLIINEININRYLNYLFTLICLIIVILQGNRYYKVYATIETVNIERDSIIEYYKVNPEVEEAWILRYPDSYLHGANVEPDDIYHLETFKRYYNLNQEPENIIFYFKEEY